jgi:predicted nucleic acid-binding protein
MASLVIDASMAAAWCFSDEQTDYTNGVLKSIPSVTAFAPRLWPYELRNSVLMGVHRGRLSRPDAESFLSSLPILRIHLTDPISYDDVFKLADATGLTVYDAAYLDLVMRESAQLATLDDALRKAALSAGVSLFDP